jgi:hypothetical protein
MVAAVRAGESRRTVARQFRVSPATVQLWVERTRGKVLDRCDWADHSSGPPRAWNRTAAGLEHHVLAIRRQLREESVLGEYGAAAIHRALFGAGQGTPVPSVRTIGRILRRGGALDAQARVRRSAPPRGWYVPAVAAGRAELESFDFIEDLKIESAERVQVLTAISLHGGVVAAWPETGLGAREVVRHLQGHWQTLGLPDYAQFDNDTRFQGAHQFPDTLGRITRLCLALGVVPVFVPPREYGFQSAIERFNGLWQSKVWGRFHYQRLATLKAQSARYAAAHRVRSAPRREGAPPRRSFPKDWCFDLQAHPRGTVIFLRRTDEAGRAYFLGRRFAIDRLWAGRLVRCEVHLDQDYIACYALRRRDPADQPLLAELPYRWPQRPFRGEPVPFGGC